LAKSQNKASAKSKSKNKSKDEKIENVKTKKKNNKIKVEIPEGKDRKKFPKEFRKLLDIDNILKGTEDKDELSITLKKDPIKGSGLFAVKPIQEGDTIAFYKMRVFKEAGYKSPTNFIYTFNIYGKKCKVYTKLIGDIDLGSFDQPINGIPFWGPLVNEPSSDQDINAEVNINTEGNFSEDGIKRVVPGIYMVYKVVAKRYIDVGEEITIYYGDEYLRDYEVSL